MHLSAFSTDGTQVPSGDDLLTEDMALDAAASDMSSMDSGTSSQPYTYRGTDIMETARNLQELSASTNSSSYGSPAFPCWWAASAL